MLPNQFRKHCESKQQPSKGEIFKIFGRGENPIWGDLAFYGGLDNPLETLK